MALIFKRSQIETDFSKLHKLFYGLPKSGKTTLASAIRCGKKEPLFILTEKGTSALSVFSQQVSNWEGFIKLINYIETNKKEVTENYSTIVLDLVSELDEFSTTYICEQNKVLALADLPFGKGWALQKAEFAKAITRLLNIMPITFISHSAEKEIGVGEARVQMQCPAMSKGALKFINGKVDIIGWIKPADLEGGKSILTFKPSKTAIAGSRFDSLIKKEFELNHLNISSSYKELAEAFKGGKK